MWMPGEHICPSDGFFPIQSPEAWRGEVTLICGPETALEHK